VTDRGRTTSEIEDSDRALYDRARNAWDEARWHDLAVLAAEPLAARADRAELALLAAAGLIQLGRMREARHQLDQARDWGCAPRLMTQVLISGAFNTLGRAACLLDDDPLARSCFEDAIATLHPDRDIAPEGQQRGVRERAALNLLPEAARLVEDRLNKAVRHDRIEPLEANMLKTQVDLLNHTLGLAQRRQQLMPDHDAAAPDERLEQRAVSQLGQDLWVLEQTGQKRGGFFVEFGATDGILLSNTLLLETQFGWTGICAEPNPAFFEKLQRNRNCITSPDCIGGQTGRTVSFILADEYGGFAEFADSDTHSDRRAAYREAGKVIELETISLDAFLKKHDAPHRIDYLSIDTEGSEFEILEAFPFADWDIRLLTIEHNFTPIRAKIRKLMEEHGYICTEQKWDDWYAKP